MSQGLGAIVLCGGQSRRMGRPKAWLPFGGEALLQRVVRRVSEVASPIVVVTAPGQEIPELPPEVAVVVDAVTGRGPLQGIAAGLEAIAARAGAAFVSSTDAPFLHPAFIRRLAELQAGGAGEHAAPYDVVVPNVGGHYHPLGALYSCSVRGEIEALLGAGRLRPFFLFERVRTLVVDEARLLADPALAAADPELASLRNVNTPEEYADAVRYADAVGDADAVGHTLIARER